MLQYWIGSGVEKGVARFIKVRGGAKKNSAEICAEYALFGVFLLAAFSYSYNVLEEPGLHKAST